MTEPQFPTQSGAYPEESQATTVLVLGILSVVLCQILGPFAWSMGSKELAAISAGRRNPENRSTANAGRILGIVGTAFLIIGVLFFLLIAILIGAGVVAGWSDIFNQATGT